MISPRPFGFVRWLQWQPQRTVGLLAVLLGLVSCLLVASNLRRDYEQQVQAAIARNDSLARLLEEHVRQTLRRIELAMSLSIREVQSQYRAKGRFDPASGTDLRAYLPDDGLIYSILVLDAKGQVVVSTQTENLHEMPLLSDRDFYQALQVPGYGGLFVGQAIRSRISGRWIIPFSMPIDGTGGILVGSVEPEYFQNLYHSIDMGDKGFVSMLTTEGWVIARSPFSADIAEKNWRNAALFRQGVAHTATGSLQGLSDSTQVDMVYSYRALQDYPLVVTLGVSRDAVLQTWRERAVYQCTGLLLVLLFLAGGTALLMGQLRRRLQAESALQLSEISLLKSSLPTLWIGKDARILRVNQAACDLHGYTEQQMLGMSVPDLNPSMPMAHWAAHWERLRKGRSMRFETVHRRGDGKDVPVEVELNFIEYDGQEYNFAFMRDLTVRKQAEQEIRRGTALLRSAMDAVDEAFVLYDTEDRLVYCNAKYIELYPHLKDVVVPGARFEDLIRVGAERGLYRESVGREEEWVAERLRAHREGVETRIQTLDDGRVMRVIDRRTPEGNIAGIRVDITEMVKTAEEAQQASRYKSQFLANMSHELRTPMNAILGLLTLLQQTALSPVQRDYASKTEGAAQSLLRLLNDILDFSKVEAGKMELDLQPLRLDRMLRDLAVILSTTMQGKAIEVLFDIDPEMPTEVLADALRLQQVLVNLGGNAIKFTERGQVVMRVRRLGDVLEFAIEDSGIGIAPEQQEHIFSGFSQAEASTTRRFGGTGLGLAISRRLVELMGGSLSVHSVVGEGSTFRFTLPLRLPTGNAGAPKPLTAPQRVLVVDDNAVARGILAAMTQSWFWPTQLTASGAEALECIRSQQTPGGRCPFDVVLLDWQMPGMDGWETARRIRLLCEGAVPRPRIIMLSANGQDRLEQRTLQEQALIDGFVFKPVTPSSLQEAALGLGRNAVDVALAPRSGDRRLAGLRILVVEDNLINQQVAEELLSVEGALVSLAANGQLGVDAVATSAPPFDVVLMDIQMPVLDGFGATRKIREELGFTQLPIIAMTANAMASDCQDCLAAGMDEHVGKPFDIAHLVTVLLQVTGRTRKQDNKHNPPVSGHTEPMFNSPYLDLAPALERMSGLSALYVEIAHEFILALDGVEADFRKAVQSGDLRGLAAQMHTLKGTSATLGASQLSTQAAALEKRFKEAAPDLAPLAHLPELLDVLARTRTDVLQAVASLAEN